MIDSKEKLQYMGLGAAIMLVGLGLGVLLSTPLVAQLEGVLPKIECEGLTVVNQQGDPAIALASTKDGDNGIVLYNAESKPVASLHTAGDDTLFAITKPDGKFAVLAGRRDERNHITVFDEQGVRAINAVVLDGQVRAISIYSATGEQAVSIDSFDEIRNNSINIYNQNGDNAVSLDSTQKIGNRINIYDKGGDLIWQRSD